MVVSRVSAQPTLPGIAGSTNNGVVILSWVCQYNGIKSIVVMRSMDSATNYSAIGHVKNKDKGVEAFVDGHPVAGRNFYKLAIVFTSGLSWSSNYCSVYVDRTSLTSPSTTLPENDSLQKFIVTEAITKPGSKDAIAHAIISDRLSAMKNNSNAGEHLKTQKQLNKDRFSKDISTENREPKHKAEVSFEMDSVDMTGGMKASAIPAAPRKKITVTFEDPGVNSLTFVKSRYVTTDPVSGHVNLDLPDDVKTHHYSLKFYDSHDHIIMEIPKINASRIIIDKRNFQLPGIYKFILRKDITELERGYIEVKPF